MGIPVKSMTTPLAPRNLNRNKKQNTRFAITDITNQDFRNLLNKFKNSPYVGHNDKQVHNKPTEY